MLLKWQEILEQVLAVRTIVPEKLSPVQMNEKYLQVKGVALIFARTISAAYPQLS